MDNLEQLAQLAKVTALLTSPQQQQQELDQKDQAARVAAAIHLFGLQQEKEHNAATLAELSKYHAGELAHGAATTEANVFGDLLRTPGSDINTIEDMLAKKYPEYGAAKERRKAAAIDAEVQRFTPIVTAADPKMRPQILATMSPEARAKVKLPETVAPAATAGLKLPPDLLATFTSGAVKLPAHYPPWLKALVGYGTSGATQLP